MNDFWAKKKEELQQQGVIPTPRPSVMAQDGPWWAEGRQIPNQQPNQPQRPSQVRTEASGPSCPHCHSGNYSKPSPTIAARCFDCGYTDGRQLNELNLPGIAAPDAQRLKVKQIEQGGHFGKSVAEINANNQVLEQSAQGRTKLG